MPKIRILRLIEYVYDDAETAERDMSHWAAPAVGITKHTGRGSTIRSTILTDLNFEEEDSGNDGHNH